MAESTSELVKNAILANKTSMDWTLVSEICERANSSYSEARKIVNLLESALSRGNPATIELCISLSSTLVYNCNTDVMKLIISKPFLGKVINIIKSENLPLSAKTQCSELIYRLADEFGNLPDFRYAEILKKELEKSSNTYLHAPAVNESEKYNSEKEREDLELAIALSITEKKAESPPVINNTLFKVRALHPFEPNEESDLRLTSGDIIDVIDTSTFTEWWKGRIGNYIGFFPSNFVEVIHPSKEPSELNIPLLDRIRALNQKLYAADQRGNSSIIADEELRCEFLELTSKKPLLQSRIDALLDKNKDTMSKLNDIDEFVNICTKHINVYHT